MKNNTITKIYNKISKTGRGKIREENLKKLLLISGLILSVLISSCNFITPDPSSELTSAVSPTPVSEPSSSSLPSPSPEISPALTPTSIPAPTQKPVIEIDGLVQLLDVDENFVIDLKYATSDNFTGQKIYPLEIAIIHKETAYKLIEANNRFRKDGYTIKVWDSYRPVHVQQIFWDVYPDPKFVARPPSVDDPNPGPSHCNGMSVDITLVDKNGIELQMPSEFDDFSDRASADYPYMSEEARKNVDYLIGVMEDCGFKNYSGEWWHFNDITSTPIKYRDIPLEDFVQ